MWMYAAKSNFNDVAFNMIIVIVPSISADVMKSLGAQTIFAVNVGSVDDINHTNYGDQLSGWWLLWKKWNPWSSPIKVRSLRLRLKMDAMCKMGAL